MSADADDILGDLAARGLIQDVSDREAIAEALSTGTRSFYIGYDPTAPSLHIGSLIPTVIMRRLQRAGHRPVALVGGATGMIGDPSGRSDERNLLDDDTIERNVAGVRSQLERLIDFEDESTGAIVVNNADWFRDIGFIEFLRDVGKHTTVSYMLAKESVRSRLEDREQGISYTEFSYMLLQAFDFVTLSRQHDCVLQAGGSDQWGNITAGIELCRRLDGKRVHGFTAPLLLDSSGEKMGKTSAGTRIWLDPNLTSAYAFYQYWLNTADEDVGRLLRIFSERPLVEIEEIEKAHEASPHKRLGQTTLAEELTTWVHGEKSLARAQKASAVMFGGSLDNLDDADLAPLTADVPSSEIARHDLEASISLVDLLVRTELAKSKGEARRLLSGGGVYINNIRVNDAEREVAITDLATESMLILRAGKKKYHILRAI